MSNEHLYVYLKSDGDLDNIYPNNRGGDFTIPLSDPLVLTPAHDWEAAVVEISFPDTFHNVHGDMTKITIGNDFYEKRIQLPPGRYTAETFVSVVNKVILNEELQLMHDMDTSFKNVDHMQFGVTVQSLEEEERYLGDAVSSEHHPHSHLSSAQTSLWERMTEKKIKVNDNFAITTPHDACDRSSESYAPGYVGERTQRFMAPWFHASEKYVQAVREGKHPYFTRICRNVANTAEKQDDKEYVDIEQGKQGKVNQEDFVRYCKDFRWQNDDDNLTFIQLYRYSRLQLYFNPHLNKIGVRPLFLNNPFGDYIIFHDERMREMLGMSSKDARKIDKFVTTYDVTTQRWRRSFLQRKRFRNFEHEQNFNLYSGQIFIYSDIIEESLVASMKANIFQILNVPEKEAKKKNTMLVYSFALPQYHGINKNMIQNIGIRLADCLGEEIRFHDNGKTTVVLHVRRKSSSTVPIQNVQNRS